MHASGNSQSHGRDSEVLLEAFRSWATISETSSYLRGVVDNERHRSFITEDMAKKLKLEFLGEVYISISVFGDSGQNRGQNRKLVRVCLQGQYDSATHFTEAIEVPAICKDILEAPMTCSFARKLVEE